MSWFRDLFFGSPEPPGADALKSRAYLVYSEWGPEMKIPRPEWLASRFPSVPPEQRDAWMHEFAAVDAYMQRLAERGGSLGGNDGEVESEVRSRFPFLTRSAISHVISRANYIAYK